MDTDTQTELLKQFVNACKKNPAILHQPRFAFYKEYLESLGAKLPPIPAEEEEVKPEIEEHSAPNPSGGEEEEPMEDLPELELDMSGVIEGEQDEPLSMGDLNREPSEEELEKANEFRSSATAALSEGNYAKAVEDFTEAIKLNSSSAILHAKRASALLQMSKPNAAIRDCNKAIELNPDSASAYKFRGRAQRLLGKFLEAHRDLATACKLDYDDVAYEWLKEVEPNAKKLQEYNRAKERRNEEKELKARTARIERAKEEHRRAAEKQKAETRTAGEGFSGGEGLPAGFGDILKDPDILALLKDEAAMAAFLDVMKNPANMAKYKDNPKVVKLFEKLMAAAGGAPPDMPPKPETKPDAAETAPPPKVPEPDLD